MRSRLPFVEIDHLCDPAPPGLIILLDSPAWFRWLAESTTTRFAYCLVDHGQGCIVGRLTVRKEHRQRGDVYWSAFRRRNDRVCKFYLGRSETLTRVRLEQIAARVMDTASAPPPSQSSTRGPPICASCAPREDESTTSRAPPRQIISLPPIRRIRQSVYFTYVNLGASGDPTSPTPAPDHRDRFSPKRP